jgi:RNA ligase (TIGR02306 family)
VLPLGEFPELGDPELGSDVTLVLGIRKWDPPVSGGGGGLGGGAPRGNFPGFITKTDQERVQNLIREVFTNRVDEDYEVTMKLDGTSFTAYVRDGEVGVCSRNLDLKLDGDFVSPLVRFAQETGLLAALQGLGRNLAVQGELMGPGIQKNREELPELRLFIFDIQDLDQHQKLLAPERQALAAQLSSASDPARILHAPVLHVGKLPARDLASMLEYVEGPSLRHPVREGLVFKSLDSGLTFKAISNKFLLKSE